MIHPTTQFRVVFGQRAWTSKRKSQIWCKEMTCGGSDGKESTCNARDLDLIPGSGRSPGGGNGHPLQYSCLENPMDRGAWRATVPGITESDTTERLSTRSLATVAPLGSPRQDHHPTSSCRRALALVAHRCPPLGALPLTSGNFHS